MYVNAMYVNAFVHTQGTQAGVFHTVIIETSYICTWQWCDWIFMIMII